MRVNWDMYLLDNYPQVIKENLSKRGFFSFALPHLEAHFVSHGVQIKEK